MRLDPHKNDLIYLALLVIIVFGLPLAILAYDIHQRPLAAKNGSKEFVLTGSVERGWIAGEVNAVDVLSLSAPAQENKPAEPLIAVDKNDRVVLKLRSSDVTHGFSLKAYGIYLTEGIQPGKTLYVSFLADKAGSFVFACNVYCGDVHQHMRGTLIVRE